MIIPVKYIILLIELFSECKVTINKIKKYKKNCNLSFDEINTIKDSSKKYFMLAKFNFYLCCKIKSVLKIGF